jgi:hypothetical protein
VTVSHTTRVGLRLLCARACFWVSLGVGVVGRLILKVAIHFAEISMDLAAEAIAIRDEPA